MRPVFLIFFALAVQCQSANLVLNKDRLDQFVSLQDNMKNMRQDDHHQMSVGMNRSVQLLAEAHRFLDRMDDFGIEDAMKQLVCQMEKMLERGDESQGQGGCFHSFVILCLVIWLVEKAVNVGRFMWRSYNQQKEGKVL